MNDFPAWAAVSDAEPPRLTLRIRRGDEWQRSFLFRQAVPGWSEKVLIDVTGVVWRAWVSTVAGVEPLAEMTIDASAAADGLIRLSLSEVQTAMNPGVYRWRLRGRAPGDVEHTAIAGPLEIVRE